MNIRTFIPQPLAPKELYTEMPFNLRIDGTYFGLLSFFSRLADEQRIVSVSGLALGSPEGEAWERSRFMPAKRWARTAS